VLCTDQCILLNQKYYPLLHCISNIIGTFIYYSWSFFSSCSKYKIIIGICRNLGHSCYMELKTLSESILITFLHASAWAYFQEDWALAPCLDLTWPPHFPDPGSHLQTPSKIETLRDQQDWLMLREFTNNDSSLYYSVPLRQDQNCYNHKKKSHHCNSTMDITTNFNSHGMGWNKAYST